MINLNHVLIKFHSDHNIIIITKNDLQYCTAVSYTVDMTQCIYLQNILTKLIARPKLQQSASISLLHML